MYQFLESLDNTTKGKYFRIFLAPIWLLLEWLCLKKYWYKIILPEFVTNDEIFSFFDKNEFGLKNGRFIKKDLIDSNEYLLGRKNEECKVIIKKEFIESLSKLISDNCSTNVEDYISLIVITDTVVTKKDDEIYRNNVYEVTIQFCRYWWFKKAQQYSFFWIVVFTLISIISYLIIR